MTFDGFAHIAEREIHEQRVGYVKTGLLLAMILFVVSSFLWLVHG